MDDMLPSAAKSPLDILQAAEQPIAALRLYRGQLDIARSIMLLSVEIQEDNVIVSYGSVLVDDILQSAEHGYAD